MNSEFLLLLCLNLKIAVDFATHKQRYYFFVAFCLWTSGHIPDGPLKPVVKSFESKHEACNASNRNSCSSGQSAKPKKSVTAQMAGMSMPLELSHLRLSEPLLDDGALYSGIRFNDLKLLLPYLKTNWKGKLNTSPKGIPSRTTWKKGSRNHASDSKSVLRSINATAILADGTNVNITHVVIEGSSQCIAGPVVTTKCDIAHINGYYMDLSDD